MGLGSPGDSLPRARGVQPRARLRPPRKPGRPRRLRGPSRALLRTRRAPPCVCPVPPGTAASWVPPQRPHEPRGNSRSRGSPREPLREPREPPSRLGSSRASVGAAPRAWRAVPLPPPRLAPFAVSLCHRTRHDPGPRGRAPRPALLDPPPAPSRARPAVLARLAPPRAFRIAPSGGLCSAPSPEPPRTRHVPVCDLQ